MVLLKRTNSCERNSHAKITMLSPISVRRRVSFFGKVRFKSAKLEACNVAPALLVHETWSSFNNATCTGTNIVWFKLAAG